MFPVVRNVDKKESDHGDGSLRYQQELLCQVHTRPLVVTDQCSATIRLSLTHTRRRQGAHACDGPLRAGTVAPGDRLAIVERCSEL